MSETRVLETPAGTIVQSLDDTTLYDALQRAGDRLVHVRLRFEPGVAGPVDLVLFRRTGVRADVVLEEIRACAGSETARPLEYFAETTAEHRDADYWGPVCADDVRDCQLIIEPA